MKTCEEIEKSIIKKFRRGIWSRFTAGIKEYELIKENDKIAVCMSGGKDSFLLAKCMQELQKHNKIKFELVFLVMNPGYNKKNKQLIIRNAKNLKIPITMFETNIFESVAKMQGSPCYICARMRRGNLYSKAKEMGCNKIALGHHFNDVIETILMSMLYGSEIKSMMPKLKSTNFENMELIRPMYYIREDDIVAWKKYNDLTFLNCACRFTENCTIDENLSKRAEMKRLIKQLKKVNDNVDINIFKSVYNVNLDTMLGYKTGKKYHWFLDDY